MEEPKDIDWLRACVREYDLAVSDQQRFAAYDDMPETIEFYQETIKYIDYLQAQLDRYKAEKR